MVDPDGDPFRRGAENPYASPSTVDANAPPLPVDDRYGGAPPALGFRDVWGTAWRLWTARPEVPCLAFTAYLACAVALPLARTAAWNSGYPAQLYGSTVANLGAWVLPAFETALQMWVFLGLNVVLLHHARGQRVTMKQLIRVGRWFFPFLVQQLCWVLMAALLALPAAVPAVVVYFTAPDRAFWTAFAVVCGYVSWGAVMALLAIRFSLATFLMVDRDEGPLAALRHSFWLTGRSRWTLVRVTVASAVVALSGLLLLGVGFLYTGGFPCVVWVVCYLKLTGQQCAIPMPAEAHSPEAERV
jgi:hypothetical protein